MDRRRLRSWIIALLVAGGLFGAHQCNRSYRRMAPIHVDVLTFTGTKLYSLIASGRRPDGFTEFVYPSQRAHQFVTEFAAEGSRGSCATLAALLEEYDALVREAEGLRGEGQEWRTRLPDLERRRDRLVTLAAEFRAQLARE